MWYCPDLFSFRDTDLQAIISACVPLVKIGIAIKWALNQSAFDVPSFETQNRHADLERKEILSKWVFNTIWALDSSKRFNDLVLTLLSGYFEAPLKGREHAHTQCFDVLRPRVAHWLYSFPLQISACIRILLQSGFIPMGQNQVWLCVYANAANKWRV